MPNKLTKRRQPYKAVILLTAGLGLVGLGLWLQKKKG